MEPLTTLLLVAQMVSAKPTDQAEVARILAEMQIDQKEEKKASDLQVRASKNQAKQHENHKRNKKAKHHRYQQPVK